MTRLRAAHGFTLIEVLVASLVLLVGASAAFALIDSANRSITTNAARVAGTNLTRELTEYARTTDYDLLQPAQVVAALRRHASIAGTLSGSTWTIERRNVTYTVTVNACTFDDPKDGVGTTPPPNACPAAAPVAGAPAADVNPDDFRRITYRLAWTARNRSGSMTQSALVVNPAGGLGPRITRFDEPTTQWTGNTLSWGAAPLPRLTSTSASSVHWTTDDGVNGGDASGGPTDWGFTWDFGPAFSTSLPWVRDGVYTVEVQAKDSRGVPGEAVLKTVHLNRHPPNKVDYFDGGVNTAFGDPVVDMRWSRYEERDLQGYRVTRLADNKPICPTTAGGAYEGLTCTDPDPIGTGIGATYRLVALDCVDLKSATCVLRAGATTTFTVDPVGVESGAPTGLTAQVEDGKPTLTWTEPAIVPNGPVLFYRVYRDDNNDGVVTFADRYDETVTPDPRYVDPNPGNTTAHRYWVTAVDQDFNESAPSDLVDSPPVT